MLLSGCSQISGSCYLKHRECPAQSNVASLRLPSGIRLQKLWSSRGYTSTRHLLRAAKDDVPSLISKPRWYCRTLAAIPYLMPLHGAWKYAETAYHLLPLLETLEFLSSPFLKVIRKLPTGFEIMYILVVIICIAKGKEWPHFLRFHIMMGMLLGIVWQIMGLVSRWMPLSVYWGKLGMHFWTGLSLAYLFTVLQCIICALGGMYADVPFVCDAAYWHTEYK